MNGYSPISLYYQQDDKQMREKEWHEKYWKTEDTEYKVSGSLNYALIHLSQARYPKYCQKYKRYVDEI